MVTSDNKICQSCKSSFVIEPEDFEFYKKISVPPPTFCSQCRLQRRLAYRNERKIFRNKSAKSGKDILALYPPESGYRIYDEAEWWADDWDAMQYGVDYDFSKPFFVQFFDLVKKVPKNASANINNVRSNYSANVGWCKDCYLLFNAGYNEDCAYGNAVSYSKNVYNVSHVAKCERIYEGFWLEQCFQARFTSQSVESSGLWFCRDCKGCTDCFGSTNLRNKTHYIFNKPYTKEEYQKAIAEMHLDMWSGLQTARKKADAVWQSNPYKFHQGINNLNCTGVYVTHSKNVQEGYLVREGEDLKYCQYIEVPPNKDSYDLTIFGYGSELSYETSVCGDGIYNVHFASEAWPQVKDAQYTVLCNGSSNLFGCVGLRKKQYCIFNKQYSKKEYEKLRAKIIQQMNEMPYVDKVGRIFKYGEFFPIEFAPFPYNSSLAYEFFPLSKEEALKQGYSWQDVNQKEYQITMNANDLPDAIGDVTDDILKQVIGCSECRRAYRIIASELQFLRTEKLPLPRLCVECRHVRRIRQRLKARLYGRTCACAGATSENKVYDNTGVHAHGAMHCQNKFMTAYAPDDSEVVYCEECYQQELI